MLNADGTQKPIHWSLFKTRFSEIFREKDFGFKLLTQLYCLYPPERNRRIRLGFYACFRSCRLSPISASAQNLRPERSAFVTQNVPKTLSEVIELAQRFEDEPARSPKQPQNKSKPEVTPTHVEKKTEGSSADDKWWSLGSVSTHITADCRNKKASEASATGGKREAAPKKVRLDGVTAHRAGKHGVRYQHVRRRPRPFDATRTLLPG